MNATVDARGAANSKLPLWRTINRSYSSYFAHFADVLRICWLWLLLAPALMAVFSSLKRSWFAGVLANSIQGVGVPVDIPAEPIELLVLQIIVAVVLFLAGVSIAVAWHRRLLLDEHPGFSASNFVARSVWRYAGVAIAMCLMLGIPALVMAEQFANWMIEQIADVAASNSSTSADLMLAMLLVYVTAATIVLRLSLLLPARAIGDPAMTFKETWNRTRGNTWRIFWGIFACSWPPILVLLIVLFLSFAIFVSMQIIDSVAVFNIVIETSYCLLILPIWIGFLSHSYRHFSGRV
jgi:hypothetical protein